MLNINDKLIKALPEIGVDAFCILQFIATHININTQTAWPGLQRIRDNCQVMSSSGETKPMPRERAQLAINTLIEKGFLHREQGRPEGGKFGKIYYRITTEWINVYLKADQAVFVDDPHRDTESRTTDDDRNTEYRDTEKPQAVNPSPNKLKRERNKLKKGEQRARTREDAPHHFPEFKSEMGINNPIDPGTGRKLYQDVYSYLVEYFKTNPVWVEEIKRETGYPGNVAPILKKYLEGLQERNEFYKLMPRTRETEFLQWLAVILAGWKRYIDNRKKWDQEKTENQRLDIRKELGLRALANSFNA